MRAVLRRGHGPAIALSLGCGEAREPDASATGLPGTTVALTTAAQSGTTDAGSGDSAGSTEAGKLDVMGMVPQMGCTKVDLVFVVDNSASMFDEQQQLIASVPGFITAIQGTLGEDYHVMVLDTDVGEGGGCYESMFNSFDCGLWCNANCPADCNCECNAEPCAPWSPQPCSALLGAGRATDGSGNDCGLGDRRWLDASDADPFSSFTCMASVGITGDPTERPAQALTTALGTLAAPGECNEGFLRDDALLIVTIISDEDDSLASPGEPGDWHDALVTAKLGNPDAVVMLGLLGDSDLPQGVCAPFDPNDNSGSQPSVHLRQWVESFHYGAWTSVCEPDYAGFFDGALASIVMACDEFVPPG
ncbi:MAG: hypothetical protein K1X88_34105 [Nannocystaceae bacterium]|nr:hypothetical protein [Nannocystaceae bacterium]